MASPICDACFILVNYMPFIPVGCIEIRWERELKILWQFGVQIFGSQNKFPLPALHKQIYFTPTLLEHIIALVELYAFVLKIPQVF